jgi:cytochrome c-type biogenesis protein CcmH
LTEEQAERGRFEIHQRMLESAVYSQKHSATAIQKSSLKPDWLIVSMIAIIPLGALALYLRIGSPEMPDYPMAQRTDITAAQNGTAGNAPAMDDIINRLRERLEQSPDDIEGWRLLSRSLISVREFHEAAIVYQKIYQMSGNLADKSNYAEARLMARGTNISPDILVIFQEVAEANPLDARANYYIGQEALERGDAKFALQTWLDLLHFSPPDSPWIPSIETKIQQAAREFNFDLDTVQVSQRAIDIAARAGLSETPSLPGPTAEDIENAQQMNKQDQDEMILTMVQRLADRLAAEPNDPEGWNRLANAYDVLGKTDKAAYARRMAVDYATN